jgi:RNA binding exosome subunit
VKTIPVTPELIAVLENALSDSYSFISECEEDLDKYSGNSKKILVVGIERRRQLAAVTKDILERYKE